MEYVLHLREYEGYFVLEKSGARVEMFGFETLAYGDTTFNCIKLSKSEH